MFSIRKKDIFSFFRAFLENLISKPELYNVSHFQLCFLNINNRAFLENLISKQEFYVSHFHLKTHKAPNFY